MGSSWSKAHSGASSSSSSPLSSGGRRGKSRGNRVLQSSCLGKPSGSRDSDTDDQVCNHRSKENRSNASCTNQMETESDQMKTDSYRKFQVEQSDKMPCISSTTELDDWGEASVSRTTSRTGNGSGRSSTQSTTSRFLSRFSFIPGNVSFRLSRASSLGSSRAYPVSSTSLAMLNNEEGLNLCSGSMSSVVDRIESQQLVDSLPASLSNRAPMQGDEDTSSNLQFDGPTTRLTNNSRGNQTISSINDDSRDYVTLREGVDANLSSPRTLNDLDIIDSRFSDRRIGAREHAERNVRFSRTLSVGRLRDRVLRRSSLSDLTFCPLQQVREVRDASPGSGRQALSGETRASATEGASLTNPSTSDHSPSSIRRSLFGIQDYEVETSRPREARYNDLLEHRSNFLERRRRIRSQVRALQRLGSRFENMSGHERSCVLSGQHRTGRCTCRVSSTDASLDDDTSTRASISRIVMLAEALFEVLDEIHQQSVVLSSRPSVSSIGSVPAPTEVVDSLPVKLYNKSQRLQNDEVAQCYICLVEYEEGDTLRILPCYHEFHRTCIDKWLKEIHRVCPLCRGDICRFDSLSAEN